MSFRPISNVETWFTTPTVGEIDTLTYAIMNGLGEISPDNKGFFKDIYIPVKIPTANGMPEDFTYVNIGMDCTELAECYHSLYGRNFIVEPLTDDGTFPYLDSIGKLARRIKTVFNMNKGKYLKLIELQGYSYDPLMDKSGKETFTYLENEGVTDKKTSHATDTTQSVTSSQTQTTNVSMYDDNPRQAQQVVTSGSGSTTEAALPANNYDDEVYTHHNADNNGAEYNGGVDEFGNTVVGGDKYHNEKRSKEERVGNIKDIIDAQRDILRFNIIQEFFDDINKQILVGVFD